MRAPLPALDKLQIGVIGLGYVGLPVAAAFGERFAVVGYDTSASRIRALQSGQDHSREFSPQDLAAAKNLRFTDDPGELAGCNVFIIAVPTPVDAHKRPDLSHLESATRTVAGQLKSGDVVIYEATVYPGCTEEVCVPILEQVSGLACCGSPAPGELAAPPDPDRSGFHVGYSPERINPGDGAHSIKKVVKITAGSSPEAAAFVDQLYRQIVDAGTHRVSCIRVAEAAKVIENTQRDLNIALVNELALIFNMLELDSLEVLEAAGTKWNFLPFRPGLVGGHCIGVDPYYLTSKAEAVGYHPEVILAGRRINDSMGRYVAQQVIRLLSARPKPLVNSRCLVLGLAFKEDCADIRNSRVVDIIGELRRYGIAVDVHDPWVDADSARAELGIELLDEPAAGAYDALVLAVAHARFREAGVDKIRSFGTEESILYDVKGIFERTAVDGRL